MPPSTCPYICCLSFRVPFKTHYNKARLVIAALAFTCLTTYLVMCPGMISSRLPPRPGCLLLVMDSPWTYSVFPLGSPDKDLEGRKYFSRGFYSSCRSPYILLVLNHEGGREGGELQHQVSVTDIISVVGREPFSGVIVL